VFGCVVTFLIGSVHTGLTSWLKRVALGPVRVYLQ